MNNFNCRYCESTCFDQVLSLQDMPITHHLSKHKSTSETLVDLDFVQCKECGLLQLLKSVSPELLYQNSSSYLTGFQKPRHIDDLLISAKAICDPGSALDIGCNDGSLMQALSEHGYQNVVGVEPIESAGKIAQSKGYNVYNQLFTHEFSCKLVNESGQFNLIICRHVLEHIDDLIDFFEGIHTLLADDALFIIETPKIEDYLLTGNPAVLWEEHVSYFSQNQLPHLLERFGFDIITSREYAFGGGSNAYICRKAETTAIAHDYSQHASGNQQLTAEFNRLYKSFSNELANLLQNAKANGWETILYGAAPRSCIILNALKLLDLVDTVLDDREEIQSCIIPGGDQVIKSLDCYSSGSQNTLCLLGVGAENEFKIKEKMQKIVPGKFISVSLFAPRDSISSFKAASHNILIK